MVETLSDRDVNSAGKATLQDVEAEDDQGPDESGAAQSELDVVEVVDMGTASQVR